MDEQERERDIDQEIRINELRETARELAGGEMVECESRGCPDDVSEAFWESVVAYEKAPWTTHHRQLVEQGIALPVSEALSDGQLTAKLWEVIEALGRRRTFLHATNHMSDRELYTRLVEDVLHRAVKLIGPGGGLMGEGCYTIDFVSSGCEEDIEAWLRYYADEEARERWIQDFPDDILPPHEDPPFDRDSRLPRRPEFDGE